MPKKQPPKQVVKVEGQLIELEERTCIGGCGLTFRCMKDSKQRLARGDCAFVCGINVKKLFGEPTPKTGRRRPRRQSRITCGTGICREDFEKWKAYIKLARDVLDEIEHNRMYIADLVMRACDESKYVSNVKTYFTFQRFADTIGVNVATVHQWVSIKRNVVDRLPEGVYRQGGYNIARKVNEKLRSEWTDAMVEKAFLDELR